MCVRVFFHLNSTNVKALVQYGQFCILLDQSQNIYCTQVILLNTEIHLVFKLTSSFQYFPSQISARYNLEGYSDFPDNFEGGPLFKDYYKK